MKGSRVTIWLVRFAVLAFILTALSVVNAHIAASRHAHSPLAPICEQIEFDDLDQVRLEPVTLSTTSTSQQLTITSEDISMLELSSFIFQPPEKA